MSVTMVRPEPGWFLEGANFARQHIRQFDDFFNEVR